MSEHRTCKETGDPIDMVCVMVGARHTHYPVVDPGHNVVALDDE